MNVRYTRQALTDLDEAREFTAQEHPAVAAAIGQRIRQAVSGLSQFPDRGSLGRVAGTRELVISGSLFVVAYRIIDGHVDVLAILHAARQWPSAFGG